MVDNTSLKMVTCADPERFFMGGLTWTMDIFSDKGKEDLNTL